jgi:hypothetical protein
MDLLHSPEMDLLFDFLLLLGFSMALAVGEMTRMLIPR